VKSPNAKGVQYLFREWEEFVSCGIAYRWRAAEEGGASFFVYREGWGGSRKSEFYPATKEGWASAWSKFSSLYPGAAAEYVKKIASAEKAYQDDKIRIKLQQETVVCIERAVFLGGYSSFDGLKREYSYDLRFLGDRLGVVISGGVEPLGELPYSGFAAFDIGGPGLVASVSGVVAPVQSILNAAIGIAQPGVNSSIKNVETAAINAVVKRVGTRTKIKTVLYMQTRDSELFFLSTEVEPDQLRIDLSPALGRLREALKSADSLEQNGSSVEVPSVITQLKDAADLVDRGFMTREEFNQLKSRLLSPGSLLHLSSW
jgi:hypothetical protein